MISLIFNPLILSQRGQSEILDHFIKQKLY